MMIKNIITLQLILLCILGNVQADRSGEEFIGSWTKIPGTICNGFESDKQFKFTTPKASTDGPWGFTDEGWITHSGGWLSAISRLTDAMVGASEPPSKVTVTDYKVFYDGQARGFNTILGKFAKDADHDNKLTGVFVGGEKVGDLNTSQRSYLITSNNRGKSWSEPVLFAEELLLHPDEPEREGLRLVLTGPTQKGTLLCSGDYFPEGKEGSGVLKDVNWRPHDLIIGRKERLASKWTYSRYPSGTFMGEQFTSGTALQLPDGRILLTVWGAKNKGENWRCGMLISDDDGVSWKFRDVAYEPDLNIRDHPAWVAGFNEQSLFLTAEGKIVSILRGRKKLGQVADSPKDTWYFRTESTDRGETWSKPELTNLAGTGATDVGLTLPDGSFLLVSRIPYSRDIYELPDPELYGLQFARSSDEGRTWHPEYIFQKDPEGNLFANYYNTMNGQFLKIKDHEWLYIFGQSDSENELFRILSFKVIVR